MGESEGGCARDAATIWLVVFNSIFALIGLGISTLGFLLRFNTQMFETYILDILTSASVDGIDLKDILQSVAIVIIVMGVILALIGLMGCFGGCCKVRTLLVVYSLVILKLLIIEIVLVIIFLVMRNEIDKRVKGALQTTLDTFKGYNSTEPVTIGWNYVFTQFDCCGIDSYTDLATATDWQKTITQSGSSYNLTAPVFCCKLTGKFPDISIPNDLDCATSPNATTSNYDKGCYKAVEDYIMEYRLALIIAVSLLVACQFLNISTACIVYQGLRAEDKKKNKNKKDNKKNNGGGKKNAGSNKNKVSDAEKGKKSTAATRNNRWVKEDNKTTGAKSTGAKNNKWVEDEKKVANKAKNPNWKVKKPANKINP